MNGDNYTKLRQLIELHEGRENRLYQDSRGIWTIGIGHNIQERGLSDAVINHIFDEDMQDVMRDCRTFPWFDYLDDVRQAAIADMIFNLGLSKFRQFQHTIDFMEEGKYYNAGEEILLGSRPDGKSHYYAQVGARAERISKMLKTGEWQE